MCSGTFNNPSMKLLVIRDAIPDTPDLITHPPAACSLPLSFSFSLLLALFPFDYPCCCIFSSSLFLSLARSPFLSLSLSSSPRFLVTVFSLFFSRRVVYRFLALFVSTAIEDNVVGRGENNIGVTKAGVYCDDSTMNFCRIDGDTPLSARTRIRKWYD